MKILASLSALLSAWPVAAAQGPGVPPGEASWFTQLPAQIIVLMMAAFVVFALIKKRWGRAIDK